MRAPSPYPSGVVCLGPGLPNDPLEPSEENKMKKTIPLVASIILFMGIYQSSFAGEIRLGGSFNYYAMTDSIFNNLYGNGGFMPGLCLSYEPIRKFEIRGEANYYRVNGKMSYNQEKITFSMIPIVLGLRLRVAEIRSLSPYLGFGFGFFPYKEELPARFGNVSESTSGFHLEGGAYLNPAKMFYLDFNVRYIIATAKSSYDDIKLGGIRAGIGVGIRI
jgi:opacity protein-like surface antigen